MEGEAKCNTNGTNEEQYKKNNNNYIEYVHKHMKCSLSWAYKKRLIIGVSKKQNKNQHKWKYYCLHNVLIILVSSCRLKSCVSPISRA